jgi:hypothetical protein
VTGSSDLQVVKVVIALQSVVHPPSSPLTSSSSERLLDRVVQDDTGRLAEACPAAVSRSRDEELAAWIDDWTEAGQGGRSAEKSRAAQLGHAGTHPSMR